MAGYDQPQEPKDDHAVALYRRYGLGKAPTMHEIEPKAIELLQNYQTALVGAELILGRRIDAKENMVVRVALMGGTPEKRAGLLIIMRATEDMQSH